MLAHPITPKTDHAAEGLFGASPIEEAPDGGTSRVDYNKAHGRKVGAPLSGGDRQAAYDALLSPKAKS